ncbi:esterase/lipase family protein [Streptomyces sp. NPDC060006]|uniref:esterase/lipase family protein n=1 Tax=unclassified Streptomyces TaxID=2593676 RepID=UPI0036339434
MAIRPRPLILVRGFGGPDVQDEQRDAYQGFNNGTVYPERRGENYIYEGFLLRALKSPRYTYRDATNVVGYYPKPVQATAPSTVWGEELTSGTVVVDPTLAERLLGQGVRGTLWIYRYYDLQPRTLEEYGRGLVQLIRIMRHASEAAGEIFPGVDIVAHSMGGLAVRAALSRIASQGEDPAALIHRIVTLGTPHRGISFQLLPGWLLSALPVVSPAAQELNAFDPDRTDFRDIPFPAERILTVVGTDYRTYGAKAASLGNRLSTFIDEGTLAYNHSDGLVKQSSAQLPGSPRTFIHKCHGGRDSLVTSREAYEIAMRFFHGTHHVQLWLDEAEVTRGYDVFGRSEFYFGVKIKPRYVDFELFHQSSEAENCYGPFHRGDFTDPLPVLTEELRAPLSAAGDDTSGWPEVTRTGSGAPRRLVWEGWVDATSKPEAAHLDDSMAFRLDVYVGERNTSPLGFSDNVVFSKQYYVHAIPDPAGPELYLHTDARLLAQDVTRDRLAAAAATEGTQVQRATPDPGSPGTFTFTVGGTGFTATMAVTITSTPAGT